MKKLGDFLRHFALPLVAGGELAVGKPVDEATAAAWRRELAGPGGAEAQAVDEAREAVAAELVVRPPRLLFGEVELGLCLALYDALALAHPATERFTARGAARARVLAVARRFVDVGAADTRDQLVARHALLWQLPHITRTDSHVRWWTGKAEFRGQRPPGRLVAWPGVRGVRVDHERVPVHELLGFEEGVILHAALLAASPLTELLTPERVAPAFTWGRAGVVLGDVELCRVVAHAWIAPERAGATLPAAGQAWERLLGQTAPAAEVRATTAFLVHVGVLACLDEHAGELDSPGAALFWALPELAAAVDPRLASPPGIQDDARLTARWAAQRERARDLLGDARAEELTRHLAARLQA